MKTIHARVLIGAILIAILATSHGSAAGFTDLNVNLPGLAGSSAAWADYDNDGDLDFVLTGSTNLAAEVVIGTSSLYENRGNNTFIKTSVPLTGLYYGASAWADYDNDGSIDLLLTGTADGIHGGTLFYRNNGVGQFTPVEVGLPGVLYSSVAWGDYDHDGYLDLVLAGASNLEAPDFAPLTRIYRNDRGTNFMDIQAGLPGLLSGAVAWGDFDQDGWLDVLLTGSTNFYATAGGPLTALYRNNRQGGFERMPTELPDLLDSAAAWGDYDADGDLDLAISGSTDLLAPDGAPLARVYRNDGGTNLTNISANLPGVMWGAVAWADCDNDGDLDLLLTGSTNSSAPGETICRVYRNDGVSGFNWDMNAGLPGVQGVVASGDADNDGDLDILLTGWGGTTNVSSVFRNNNATANTPPNAPTNLVSVARDFGVTLQWNTASDAETRMAGLSYNLRVGTNSSGGQTVSPHAETNGFRRVPQMGNVPCGLSATLTNLAPGLYYWSVQAVDAGLAGSPFGGEQSFQIVAQPPGVTTLPPSHLTPSEATLNGTVNPGGSPTWIWFQWGTDSSYGRVTAATSIGFGVQTVVLASTLTGLTPEITYHYRIVATNNLGTRYGEDATFAWRLLVVTNLTDGGSGSLRQSIAEAGQGATLDLLQIRGVMRLTNELMLDKDLVLLGPGATNLAISGNLSSRVFRVNSGTKVTLSNVAIQDGRGRNGTLGYPGTSGESGGGIYNAGWLNLIDCVLTNNQAGNGGDGLMGYYTGSWGSTGGWGGEGGKGGGIFNNGELWIEGCTLIGNASGTGGRGGQGGTGGNSSSTGYPGGTGGAGGAGGAGAGIFSAGRLVMNRCTVSTNYNGAGGTGGSGGTGGQNNPIWPHIHLHWGGNGGTGGAGGAGGSGGAVMGVGQMSLTNCTISGNATGLGGAGGNGGNGGHGSTTGNRGFGGNGGCGGNAGGIGTSEGFVGGSVRLALFNCTIAFNVTGAGGSGGPVGSGSTDTGATAGIRGGNGFGGGIGWSRYGDGVQILNTIVAQNTNPTNTDDVLGCFASLGHNLVGIVTTNSTGFGAIGDLLNTNPRLGPLADNGGPTWTHAPLAGSPVINAGDNAGAPLTDQRGFLRIDEQSQRIDIGAFEVQTPFSSITAIIRELGPSCRLSCRGMPNAPYVLEASSNLVHWTTITNLIAGQNGVFEWRDTNVNDPVRFYRLRLP